MSDENKIVPIEGKRKRGRPPGQMQKKEQPPQMTVADAQELSRNIFRELMYSYNQPKVMSDNQLRDRLNEYLNRCYRGGIKPTVEAGLLATGYSKPYMLEIAKGRCRCRYFTPQASEIVQKFLDIVSAWSAQMVLEGQIPQIPYIFREKNYGGMSDKVEVMANTNANDDDQLNLDDIAARYVVDTKFADEQKGAEQE